MSGIQGSMRSPRIRREPHSSPTFFRSRGETEFLQRLIVKGERVVYTPAARVNHIIDKHQLEIGWLLKRGFRLGRGIARLKPDLQSARFRGIPRHLWSNIPSTFARYAISRFQRGRARFDGGLGLYFQFGQLYEYHLLRTEAERSSKPTPDGRPDFHSS
jgi:hypothetical protein